ncbi:MAG: MFS transporter [Gammaproteobacteria bacterium]|nr:MFS transporter [Gammaproteobacteria bacterium]
MNMPLPWPSPLRAWYAVAILVLAFILSFVDRIVIALLVEPIKADLGISDFGIGLLQGFAFALFYALLGIPIGRLSDRVSRRGIIATGIVVWSLMTAACGLARSFFGLFLARVGVGVGEATLSPAAYSMISDYFPREKLGRALGVYQSGALLGAGIAFLVGGAAVQMLSAHDGQVLPILGEVRMWQLAFFVVGLPGLLIALLMLTVKEPVRRGKASGTASGIPLREVLAYMRSHRRLFAAHFAGFALLVVPITTVLAWAPTYLSRVLGFARAESGFVLGVMLLILSPAAVYFGGWLIDFLQKRGHADAPFRVSIGAALAIIPLSLFATTGTGPTLALWLIGPLIFCACISQAAAPTVIQVMVPNEMRAQISAVWMLCMNLISTILGPTMVGFITVYVLMDDMAVGQSIALVNVLSAPVSAFILWLGLRQFRLEQAVSAG